MSINKNVFILFSCICFIVPCMIVTIPTHVYVRNCTPLRFEIAIDYEGSTSTKQNFWHKGTDTITPYYMPEEQNMVLAIDRLLPQGEHLYTIKLVHGAETLYLKQKFISQNAQKESELGISLESTCLHDPWFMNSQAKERHEHLLSMNGHTIVIVYYAYDNNNNEDIEYILYEKVPPSTEIATHTHVSRKNLDYSLAIPVIPSCATPNQQPSLINIMPKPLQYLARTILASKQVQSTSHDTSSFASPVTQNSHTHTHECDIQSSQKIVYNDSTSDDQLVHENLQNGSPVTPTKFSRTPEKEIIDYIAHKELWYSVVDSKTTTQFWIPRNKMTSSLSQQS